MRVNGTWIEQRIYPIDDYPLAFTGRYQLTAEAGEWFGDLMGIATDSGEMTWYWGSGTRLYEGLSYRGVMHEAGDGDAIVQGYVYPQALDGFCWDVSVCVNPLP